jgi:hypothetical protein
MPQRTLSERELNRAMLARQLLLRRASISIPRALERVCGLQMQYAPTGYIGLWTRRLGFRRDALTRALERGSVVQATLMRATIHMVSGDDYPLFAEAVRRSRREWWTGVAGREVSVDAVRDAAARVRSALRDGPRRRRDLVDDLGLDAATWNGVALWVDLVRVPPSGTWEHRRADLYALAEDRVVRSTEASEERAVEHLVRRYLAAFGPASAKDVASFTSLPRSTLEGAFVRLQLRRFRDEAGGELLDVPRAPLPDPDVPAPVRFLGTWEAPLLVHARRTQVLPEAYRPLVFDTKTPHSVPTFLVDGAVAGTWRHDGRRVRIAPFGPMPRTARRDVEDEAARLAAFMS